MRHKIWKITKNAWLFFLDLIFPIECLGCDQEGAWLCDACFKKIRFKSGQYCLNCKKENVFGEFCPACREELNGVWIASIYDDPLVAAAVKSFKYQFVAGLATDLSRLLIFFFDRLAEKSRLAEGDLATGLAASRLEEASRAPGALLNFKENLVLPVPLSPKRRRWRGFNQAEILAKSFAGHYGLEFNGRDLIRLKHKKPQAKLSEAERLKNVKDCFAWTGNGLEKRNVILIDDVVTTGATLSECAKVLKAAGAGEVWGLVVAKG